MQQINISWGCEEHGAIPYEPRVRALPENCYEMIIPPTRKVLRTWMSKERNEVIWCPMC